MKFKYNLLGIALVSLLAAGATSCSDSNDDKQGAPIQKEDLVLTEGVQKLKIGEENRIALPIEKGNGDYNAFSLNPDVADVVTTDNGQVLVEGFANGVTHIVVTDAAGYYKKFQVSVYTTDQLQLTHSLAELSTKKGQWQTVSGLGVLLGNGNYSVESDNSNIDVTCDAETGAIQFQAASADNPFSGTITVTDQSGLTAQLAVNVLPMSHKVKIGADNKVEVTESNINNVECLDPATADVENVGDKWYVTGKANGAARIKITTADAIKQFTYSVYTTDVLVLSATTLNFNAPMGVTSSDNSVSVTLGNGNYSVTKTDPRISASVNSAGQITVSTKPGKTAFSDQLTVMDGSGLTATLTVNVNPTFEPFTEADIQNILAQTSTTLYGECKDPSDGTQPYYFRWWKNYGYGEYTFQQIGSMNLLGWECIMYGSNYGELRVEYPQSATVGQEVTGKLTYRYSSASWYDLYTYVGTTKVLEDNDTRVVVIFSKVDMDNEVINRAYFVYYK